MKKLIFTLFLSLCEMVVFAQVGIGTDTPHPSAQLELAALDKGLLIPRINFASRPASPATGLLIYQVDNSPGFYYYDGTAWQNIGIAGVGWSLNGNSGLPATSFIGSTDNAFVHFKMNNFKSGLISDYSTFFGYKAGMSATGNFNTAFGSTSMNSNTSGIDNTAVGYASLALVVSGNDNAALGYNTLASNKASYNTAVGSNALAYNITGSNNTAIGYNAGPSNLSTNLNNTTSIGNGAMAYTSNSIMIGNTAITKFEGYAPYFSLSDIRFKKDVKPEKHGLDFILKLKPILYHLNMEKLNGFIYGKMNSKLNDGYEKHALQQKASIEYSGFSAQEVENAAKAVGFHFSGVHHPENEQDHYALDYAGFVVPLVKAIQEQQIMIEKLRQENKRIKKQLSYLVPKNKMN